MKEEEVCVVNSDGGVLLVELQGALVRRARVVDVLQVSQGHCKIRKSLFMAQELRKS